MYARSVDTSVASPVDSFEGGSSLFSLSVNLTERSPSVYHTLSHAFFAPTVFFPRSCPIGRNSCIRDSRRLRRLQELVRSAVSTMTGMIPADGESATHQLPMPPHRPVAPDLILRPAQGVLDLFIALFDPHP